MFLQMIEIETSRMPEIQSLTEEWVAKTEGKRTAIRTTTARDVSRADHYFFLVEFPDQIAAKDNSALPETDEFAKKVERLVRGPVVFRDLEVMGAEEHARSGRTMVDCRMWPSEAACTLTIGGKPDEVMEAAVEHAVKVHGETDGPELREGIREAMRDEPFGR
ncbi:uncharacterized protein DUF1059 [Actinocorallia herbida]|uniref:Uncharacterized protein DUF1059 n=1 Tax=Actinocorallia herbida TaxID=58109 RepID=A0A3N1CN09_9ACTN|nr:DUF1059 domain-containing protein [Actinocorallia herbida]ROO82692.1 uncharacterized protein DUF1059 [Actinocorallia herbida]